MTPMQYIVGLLSVFVAMILGLVTLFFRLSDKNERALERHISLLRDQLPAAKDLEAQVNVIKEYYATREDTIKREYEKALAEKDEEKIRDLEKYEQLKVQYDEVVRKLQTTSYQSGSMPLHFGAEYYQALVDALTRCWFYTAEELARREE